jgi:hypothetical protein
MAYTEFDGVLDDEVPGFVEFTGELDKPKDTGFLGTFKEGAKGTLRNLGASVDTLQGDEGEVVSASRAAAEAPKDPALKEVANAQRLQLRQAAAQAELNRRATEGVDPELPSSRVN